MRERTITLPQAYGLISGGNISRGKKEIKQKALFDEFMNKERGNRRKTTKRDLIKRMDRTL